VTASYVTVYWINITEVTEVESVYKTDRVVSASNHQT